MEPAQTALLPATPLQTLLDDIRSQSRSETDKGRAFEGIITASLPTLDSQPMTNASLRERFGIPPENSAMVTRVIKESVAEGFVKPFDEEQSRRHAKYLPFWA